MASNDTQIRITAVDATQAAFASVTNGLKSVEGAASGLNTIAARIPMLGTAVAAALGGASISGFIQSTIDAADNLNDLSQSLGLSIRDLTAYKLVADQSGTSLESVGRGIKKLSTTIVENGKALRAAGVDTKSASSAMEGIADLFAGMPDGIEKTALATKLFGEKIGSELIPMLNQGSQALRESADRTKVLGDLYSRMAPDADKFNDALAELKLYGTAAGVSMASTVVPALKDAAYWMAEGAREGGMLKAALLGMGSITLSIFGVETNPLKRAEADVSELFANLKREQEALAVFQRNMNSESRKGGLLGGIMSSLDKRDIDDANQRIAEIQKSLNAAIKLRDKLAANESALSSSGKNKPASSAVIPDFTNAAKDAADTLQKSLDAIRNQSLALDVGLSADTIKNIETLGEAWAKGKVSLAEYNKLLGDVLDKDSILAAEQKELTQAHQEYMRSIGDETAKLIEKAAASELELQTIGLTSDQMAALTARRYDEQIAIKEAALESARGVAGREAEVFLIEQQIDALRRLKGTEIAKPKLQEQAREWEKFTSDIERGLTDSLYRAFENGDGFGQTFVDSLKNTLKAAALKVVVQAIVDPVMGGVKGVLSGPAGASGYANQGSSFLGSIGNANTVWSGAVNTGTAITGIGNLIGSSMVSSFGTGMSLGSAGAAEAIAAYQAAAAANAGTAAGASYAATASSMSAGASVASAMPYVAAAIAVYSLFSKKGKEDPHNNADTVYASFRASSAGASGYGRVPEDGASNEIVPYTTVMGQTSGRGRWGDSTAMTAEQIATLNTGLAAMYQSAHKMAEMFGVSGDAIDSVTLDIQSQATASEGLGVAMQRGLDKLSDALTRAVLPNIDDFRLGSETLGQTLARVASNMQAVDAWGERLGFTLNGLTEKNALTSAFGDSSTMNTALDAYYQSYYSEQERSARMGAELAASFAALNVEMPSSKDGLRAMIDATVASKDGWEQTYASLVALSGPYAEYIATLNTSVAAVEDSTAVLRARQEWQSQLDVLNGAITQQEQDRAKALAGTTDEATQAIMRQVFALQDQTLATESAAEAARTRQEWQNQIDILAGTRTQQDIERASQLASTSDAATQAIMRQVFAMQDQSAAADAAAEALRQQTADIAEATGQRDSLLMQFGTAQDQLAMQTAKVNDAFAKLGMAVPKTAEAFRKAAEAADINTASGRTIIATLSGVAEAFKATAQQGQSYVSAYNPNTIRKAMQSALPEFGNQASIDAGNAERALSTSRGLAKSIDDLIYRLRHGNDTLSPELSYLQAKQEFMLESAKARMGDADAIGRLSGVSEALLEASKAYYGSGQGYSEDYALTLQQLGEVQGTANRQVSIAEQQLAALQEISNKLNPKPGSELANANALDAYAQAGYSKFLSQISGSDWANRLPDSFSALRAAYDIYKDATPDVDKIPAGPEGTNQALAISSFFSSNGLRGLIDVVNAPGLVQSGQSIHMVGLARFLWDSFAGGNRAFADGGFASPGWALVGERGPEVVNFSAPARVYTADQTRQMFGQQGSGGADAESKQLLREQNDLLRAMLSQNGQASNAQLRRLESLERRLAQIESDGSLLRAAA